MTITSARYTAPSYDVKLAGDIVFGESRNESGAMETLRLDVYLPEDDPEPLRPAIIWVHGGGFTFGNDKRQRYIPMFANTFAARGYVGVAPDYRVRAHPEEDMSGALRDAVADVRMALAWVRQHAAAYGVDTKRIALAGGSAGGLTVLKLVHDPEQPVNAERDGLFAVLDMWGTPGEGWHRIERVNPQSPPTLIIHGTADAMAPYHHSEVFAEELAQAGVECRLLTLEGAPHTPLDHFDDIVAAMTDFLRTSLARTDGA